MKRKSAQRAPWLPARAKRVVGVSKKSEAKPLAARAAKASPKKPVANAVRRTRIVSRSAESVPVTAVHVEQEATHDTLVSEKELHAYLALANFEPASVRATASVPALLAPVHNAPQAPVQRAMTTHAAMRAPWHAMAAFFGLAFAAVAAMSVIRNVDAATYQGPTVAAPGGNIPVTIWNRAISAAQQVAAAIDIDGNGGTFKGFSVGSNALVLGAAQNLVYGNVDTTSSGNLLLLQNESADKFKVDSAGNVTSQGSVKGAGCFGRTFVGVTPTAYHGSLGAVGSYFGADNKCSIAYAGSHVCKPDELLESISCSVASDPIRTSGGQYAWINAGPPGYTALSNDCVGWTNNSSASYGRVWLFDNTTGGTGTMTPCDTSGGLKYACCK